MATYDIIYFRVINFLKIALPFFGVSLIIAMFVLSRDQASQAVLPFDKNEFAEELAKQQINKLYYSGQTDAGDELSLSAQSAVEGFEGQKVLEMKTVSAKVKSKNGLEIEATAQFGQYLYSENLLKMSGSVLISSSSGYRLSAPELRISTDGTSIFGEGPVEGLTPLGKIYAGKMEIKRKTPKSPMQVWFSDRVLVDYLPELQNTSLSFLRLDLRHLDFSANWLIKMTELLKSFDKEKCNALKSAWPTKITHGFFRANRTDLAIERIKNPHLKDHGETLVGYVVEAVKDAHLIILARKTFLFAKTLQGITPEGRECEIATKDIQTTDGQPVTEIVSGNLYQVPHVKYVTAQTLVYSRYE